MADNTSGLTSDLTNASLMSELMEREAFEKDFNLFIKYLRPEDLTKIYTCIDILLDERKNSGSEPSSNDTLALPSARQPEDVKIWSATQNASNFTWSATNTSTLCLQNDVPPKNEKHSPTAVNQTQILEEVFSSSQYIVGKKRRAMAELLGLTEKQVSLWFEHRRRRMRLEQSELYGNVKFVPATLVRRQPIHVDAHLVVKQESFDAGYDCSSNLSTEEDVAGKIYSVMPTFDSEDMSPNKNTEHNGFF